MGVGVELASLTLQERRDRSALVVLVPEVQELIGAIRSDTTEDGASVPPHITLYNPFFAPLETTPDVHERIASIVSRVPCFTFSLTHVDRFPPRILYLAPDPVEPFLDLIARLRQEFTEVSPYWDRVDGVVPHVTVADAGATGTGADLDAIAATIAGDLPVVCEAREVVLLQRVRPSPAPWDVTGVFPFPRPARQEMR